MKICTLLLGFFLLISSVSHASSSSSDNREVGTFRILAFAKDDGFTLGNNNTFVPVKHHYAKLSKNWQVNDRIRLLTTGHGNKFILINVETGEEIRAKQIVL